MSTHVYGYTTNKKSSFVLGDIGALKSHWSPTTALNSYHHPDEQRQEMERVNNNRQFNQGTTTKAQSSSSDGLLGGLLLDNLLASLFGPAAMVFTAIELMDQAWVDRRDPARTEAGWVGGRQHAYQRTPVFGLF